MNKTEFVTVWFRDHGNGNQYRQAVADKVDNLIAADNTIVGMTENGSDESFPLRTCIYYRKAANS